MYSKKIKLVSKCNGYERFYDKYHPLALKDGMVYYHRHIVSIDIGKWLTSNEHVHHIDGNKSNNNISNLMIVAANTHRSIEFPIIEKKCKYCSNTFLPTQNRIIYCSQKCSALSRRKVERPSKEYLFELVWKMPSVKIARMYGVSDRCIKKWCDYYSISKPPRGYWAKKKTHSKSS